MKVTPEDRRYKRCYHRVMSGLEKGGSLRFVTLTESDQAKSPILRDFRRLIMRLRRRGILKDYLRVIEVKPNGREHIHMIFRGSYIDQALLSSLWDQLHQSPVVDIRKVKFHKGRKGPVAREMAKYMAKELCRRYSWSWGWVYKGFVKTWKAGISLFMTLQRIPRINAKFSAFLALWQVHLRKNTPPEAFLNMLR